MNLRRFSCTLFSLALSVLYVLLYLSPLSICHVSRYDPLTLITLSLLAHIISPAPQCIPHISFFWFPSTLLPLLIEFRVSLTSPPFFRFGSQAKDLSL